MNNISNRKCTKQSTAQSIIFSVFSVKNYQVLTKFGDIIINMYMYYIIMLDYIKIGIFTHNWSVYSILLLNTLFSVKYIHRIVQIYWLLAIKGAEISWFVICFYTLFYGLIQLIYTNYRFYLYLLMLSLQSSKLSVPTICI